MVIKNVNDFYTKKDGYRIPKNFLRVAHILFDFEEVAKFAKENNLESSDICIAFETEAEKEFFETKKAEWLKNREEKLEKDYISHCISKLPKEVAKVVSEWDVVSKSPYSDSFYNAKEICWDSKPEGSLRISDHWNFESRGVTHCKLNTTSEYISGTWILARYVDGVYIEIRRF